MNDEEIMIAVVTTFEPPHLFEGVIWYEAESLLM
jgi:hypothetical protein